MHVIRIASASVIPVEEEDEEEEDDEDEEEEDEEDDADEDDEDDDTDDSNNDNGDNTSVVDIVIVVALFSSCFMSVAIFKTSPLFNIPPGRGSCISSIGGGGSVGD